MAVPYIGVGLLAPLFADVDVPGALRLAAVTILGALVKPVIAATSRLHIEALDDAGHAVLVAAGHDPATVARHVFAGQEDPPFHRQFFSQQPAPSDRLAAAEARRPAAEPPLF